MRIHFLGIGGIGVSALAQLFFAQGNKVTGSDLNLSSEVIGDLKRKGIKIYPPLKAPFWKKKSNLPDLVVYSPAVPPKDAERVAAKKLKIPSLSYPQALGELTKKYFTIGVCGTHGKSTTTSMLALVLIEAGFDPTVIVGTRLKEFGNSNFRIGKSPYLVIEADEYKDSFLNYWPKLIVLNNIEKDHLDYFKNLRNILFSFREFIKHLPEDGYLVFNQDDKRCVSLSKFAKNKVAFSLKQAEAKEIKKVLKVPGVHNIANALAVLRAAKVLGIKEKVIYKALSRFQGTWRRLEEKEVKKGKLKFKLVHDYGHHPTEIKATLKALREKYPKEKIICVFQPHQYQRTYYLWKDFVKVLREATDFIDEIVICDIYDVAGRETPNLKKKVSSAKLVKAINRKSVVYISQEKLLSYLSQSIKGGEVLLMMGAGNIYDFAQKFIGLYNN